MPIVVGERCPQDHRCPLVNACPVGAILQKGFQTPVLDESKCIECGVCAKYCPHHAFSDRPENREESVSATISFS